MWNKMGIRAVRIKLYESVRFRLHARSPRMIPGSKGGKKRKMVESREAARDDMVAKARDQTRMIITRVVNTSLDVILF